MPGRHWFASQSLPVPSRDNSVQTKALGKQLVKFRIQYFFGKVIVPFRCDIGEEGEVQFELPKIFHDGGRRRKSHHGTCTVPLRNFHPIKTVYSTVHLDEPLHFHPELHENHDNFSFQVSNDSQQKHDYLNREPGHSDHYLPVGIHCCTALDLFKS